MGDGVPYKSTGVLDGRIECEPVGQVGGDGGGKCAAGAVGLATVHAIVLEREHPARRVEDIDNVRALLLILRAFRLHVTALDYAGHAVLDRNRFSRILLLFDAHKLDISDEFREAILVLKVSSHTHQLSSHSRHSRHNAIPLIALITL